MLRELAVNTRVIYYLMALLGIIGVLAKAVNQQTLNQNTNMHVWYMTV